VAGVWARDNVKFREMRASVRNCRREAMMIESQALVQVKDDAVILSREWANRGLK
jgi:hypothetical protein